MRAARIRLGRRGPRAGGDAVGFDIAALELYLPLISGAPLWWSTRRATVQDAAALAQLIAEQRRHVMQATPTLWQALAEPTAAA